MKRKQESDKTRKKLILEEKVAWEKIFGGT
jgi:hypothetical protein